MANELALPASFGKLPSAFEGAPATNDELGAGVASSYAVMGFRGKVWAVKFGGDETQLMRDDGDGPRNSIEVVLLKASPAISKIFYKNGYTDGANQPPDCWSGNGIVPDPSVQNKVSPTCANCPMNAWGSRTTDAGKQAKACADSRRVAIAPLNDLENEAFGGPMLLRIPAASLKDLKAYGDLLGQHGFPYYAAATRISFDANEAFPKFVFTALRPLLEPEAAKVMQLREDRRIAVVLAETAATVASTVAGAAAEAAKEVPASPFEQGATTTAAQATTNPAPKATTTKAKATTTKAPAAAAATETPEQKRIRELEAAIAAQAAKAAEPVETPEQKRIRELEAALAANKPVGVASLLAEGADDEVTDEVTNDAAPTTAEFDSLLENLLGD